MTDHKAECVLSDPCSADEPRHGYCGNSDRSWCIHCEKKCICNRIKRAEDRVRAEHDEYRAMLGGIEFGAERSWDYALDAALGAVITLFPKSRYPDEHAAVVSTIDGLRGKT